MEQFTEESPKFGMPERFLFHLIRVPWYVSNLILVVECITYYRYSFRVRILYYNKVFEDLIEDFTPSFVTLINAFDGESTLYTQSYVH